MDDPELAQQQQASRDENVRLVEITMKALEDFYSTSAVHIRLWKRYDFARDLLEKLLAKAHTDNMGNRWLREQLLKIWEYATIEAIEGLEK